MPLIRSPLGKSLWTFLLDDLRYTLATNSEDATDGRIGVPALMGLDNSPSQILAGLVP